MEQNFQTSFIPKKPIVSERAIAPRPVSALTVVALLVLFTALLATGGLYSWRELTGKKIVTMQENLGLAQNRFEPSKISELQLLDKRLRASSEILSGHVAITPIFEALEKITMKTVRFTTFSYAYAEDKLPIVVKMSGEAVGYRSVALQSDLFAQNKNFIDPVFSNLVLDQSGNVLFDLEFSLDPAFLNYKQTLSAESVPEELVP